MFEYSKSIMEKIKNKEDLSRNELMYIERGLRSMDFLDSMLDTQIALPNAKNIAELTVNTEGEIKNDLSA